MATKSENVPVKRDGDNGTAAHTPFTGLYSPMADLHSGFDQMFGRFLPRGWPQMGMGSLMDFDPLRGEVDMNLGGTLYGTKADISETDSEYEISVELLGIGEEDIDIDVSEGMLTMSAEKREEREEKK